jgi:clan AA aspartic protease
MVDVDATECGWDDLPGAMAVGTFTVDVTFRNPHDRARTRAVSLLVDTGATWTTLPQDVVETLECAPVSHRRVRLATGRVETWPMTIVLVTLLDQELPTVCLVAPAGGPALLGAVTLEEFALSVDPVARRLVPVDGYLMASARGGAYFPAASS